MKSRLAKLAELAEMIRDAELARLSQAEGARRRIGEQVSTLRTLRTTALSQAEPDPAHISGTSERWQSWATGQLQLLNQQHALAAAEAEAQKRVAARAFGRAMSLARISERNGSG